MSHGKALLISAAVAAAVVLAFAKVKFLNDLIAAKSA